MPTAFRLVRSSFLGFYRVATKEGLEFFLKIHKVDLDSLNGVFDFLEADFLVGFVGTIDCLLVAILLDNLAAVPNLVEAQSS